MPFKMTCPQCGKTFSLRDELAGKAVRCLCGKTIPVPVSTGGPEMAMRKPQTVQASSEGEEAVLSSDRPPLRFTVAAALVGGGLLLVFLITVGLVVYLSTRSKEQTEHKAIVSDMPRRHEESSRLLDGREPERTTAALPPARETERPSPESSPFGDTTPKELSKSLATMDRLTFAVAPLEEQEPPPPEVWTGHTASIRGVAYTDDGRFVVSVSGAIQKVGKKADNSIRVWDARRGKQIHKLDGFREALDAVSVSPGGRFAVFGHGGHYERDKWVDATDHHIRLWDIQDNREVYLHKRFDAAEASSSGAEARFQGLQSSAECTAFSPDRKLLLGADNSGKVILWEIESGKPLYHNEIEATARLRVDAPFGQTARVTIHGAHCVFTPDGRRLLTGGADYTVRLLDAATGEQVHVFESHEDIVWAIAATRTKQGRLLGLSGGGHRQRLDGGGQVPGARDYAIRLWDLEDRKEIRRFVGHDDSVSALVFCPNGRHFLSAGSDKTVLLWDIANGTLLRTYRGHTDGIRSISIAPDGRTAVSGGDDCTIRYWRLPATVDDVILALDKKNPADLSAALRDVDTMGPELRVAFPKLVQAIRQNDKGMAEPALTILRQLGKPDKEWVDVLRALLTNSLPAARAFAAEALALLGTEALPALAELRKTLADADPMVRRNAVAALTHLGKEAREAASELAALMESEAEEEFKIQVIHTLGKIQSASKLKLLFRDLKEPALLTAILDALASVEERESGLVEILTRKGLRHEDAAIRSKTLDSLRRIGVDALPLATLVSLKLDDASKDVRTRAAKLLDERMKQLSAADLPDVRALLGMTDKPEAAAIGLQAVTRLGPKAKELLPDLLKNLSNAEEEQKLETTLALTAIDAKDKKIIAAVVPILVAALRPKTKEDKPSEAVLKSLTAIGKPTVEEIFKALKKADERGVLNANNRKALFLALQRLGREAYSEGNLQLLRQYQNKELYRDVQQAASKAIYEMTP